MRLIGFFLGFAFLTSCSDDCQTCTDMSAPSPIITEWCDDGITIFTDENGQEITFDQLIESMEEQGVVCE